MEAGLAVWENKSIFEGRLTGANRELFAALGGGRVFLVLWKWYNNEGHSRKEHLSLGRTKTVFFCGECGYEAGKWLGRCPACGAWNSFCEAPGRQKRQGFSFLPAARQAPEPLTTAAPDAVEERLPGRFGELDRVLGGGIVPGSVALLGGAPGIGKSTLLLQLAAQAAERHGIVLYVSGEESRRQVQMRARRLKLSSERLYFLAETDLEGICRAVEELSPVLLIIDSIQTTFHPDLPLAAGSVGQLCRCTAELVRLAKSRNIACFLVGHVTKEGNLAGPRVLEHMVDVVLSFEGERHQNLRLLRAVKNRFGATDEVAVFAMGEGGLEEVENPSAIFLAGRSGGVPGSVVVAALEGTRPILVEIQALVCPAAYGSPRRAATGVDYNRVVLIAAVLEKRVGLALAGQDIYVGVVGGLRIGEPAADLGIALALASSYRNAAVDREMVVAGEIGLTGEVRAVGYMDQRLKEAARLGFRRVLVPWRNLDLQKKYPDLEFTGVKTVRDALDQAICQC
ncbi:DNA repair protein RadA [Thermacetogenium phaeum DSM 12270]|uniref:DNA repair protein RadA n=1 Tax=Thermacetogenium phaeum (strain ATCC BAA-254 / DSM 26808 / PB) TaxID=1089553 RepID=K4LCX0_THEPS|nr:DNA repair protein RadA [Thermacetogenium phaeum DSM 12270]